MAHILVLEDERIVKNLVSIILRQQNHHVRQAGSAQEAESICQQNVIDVLVADINLQNGVSGTEFACQLIHAQPHIGCLFMSGTPLEAWTEADRRNLTTIPPERYAVLTKPILPSDLLQAVGELLAGNQPSAGTRNPWLQTIQTILSSIAEWLESGREGHDGWNLNIAAGHLALKELLAVRDGTEFDAADDPIQEAVLRMIPAVSSALLALQNQRRQEALERINSALAAVHEAG